MRKMRLTGFVAFLTLSLLCLSCNKDRNGKDAWKLQAGIESLQTRTVLAPGDDGGNYPVRWEEGDAIAVNGMLSRALTTSEAGTSSATFSFDSKPASASVYNVLYPGSASTSSVIFPAVQTYVQGTFCKEAAPLYGHTDRPDGMAGLRSCAAVIRFAIKGDVTLSAMEVTAPGSEKISGEFTMGKDGIGALDGTLTPSPGASSRMDYSFEEGLTLTGEGADIVFTVPGGAYSRGIHTELTASDGKVMALSFVPSGVTLPAATVCSFPDITFLPGKEITFVSTDATTGEITDLEESAGTPAMDAEEAVEAVSLKVGSYNIWAPEARHTVMENDATVSAQRSWANSYKAVAAMINFLDCDVMGLQEITNRVFKTTITPPKEDYDGVVHTLNASIPDYSWVIFNGSNTTYDNLFPNNTTANGLSNTDAIIYKSSILTLVSQGRYWITGKRTTPGSPTDGYGSNRVAVWARFTHKASGKQFVFISVHLDLPNAGPEEDKFLPQRRNIEELIGWAAPYVCPETIPSVIVGDMNVDKGDEGGNYARLVGGRWKDAYETMLADGSLSYTDQHHKGTMNANKNEEGGLSTWRPDHILLDGLTPSYYKVGRERFPTEDGTMHWPSDHFPIKVIVHF